jgi:hypothetical protein
VSCTSVEHRAFEWRRGCQLTAGGGPRSLQVLPAVPCPTELKIVDSYKKPALRVGVSSRPQSPHFFIISSYFLPVIVTVTVTTTSTSSRSRELPSTTTTTTTTSSISTDHQSPVLLVVTTTVCSCDVTATDVSVMARDGCSFSNIFTDPQRCRSAALVLSSSREDGTLLNCFCSTNPEYCSAALALHSGLGAPCNPCSNPR